MAAPPASTPAADPFRRHSSATSSSSNPRFIPPAPPLPPDHPPRPAAPTFLDRFLYGPRRLTSHHQSQPAAQNGHAANPNSKELKGQLLFTPNYSHASSQSTSHRTGLKLRALDINESRSHVVLAGVKILKTVRVQNGTCTEDVNIRSAAVNYAWNDVNPQQDTASVQRETFDIEDVAWSSGRWSSYIATAASNGKIMLYDLNRPGVEVGRLYEHHRQVHKVDFNPHEGQFLLSGSQDGTVRLWDIRTPNRVIECKSKDTFPGRSDGIRHTKWSPTNQWHFALGTDNGTIQRWDIRKNKAPALKILAHTKTCTSIDWHPDGRHMISASKDQGVKVWDLFADRKQKPAFEIRCPKPVQNVRWRPPCYVADGSEQWIKQCTHFATSYRYHPVVHVWDLRRPFVPYREFHHRVNSGTTDLMWQSQDLLWTVGQEGEFCQSDIRYVPRVADQRPLQAFSQAPTGDLSFFTQERPRIQSSGRDFHPDLVADHGPGRSKRHQSGSPNLKVGSFGRGDAHSDEGQLSSSLPKAHSRTSSFRSGASLGATPPSYEDFARPVNQLNQTMGSGSPPNYCQVAKIGPTPIQDVGLRLSTRFMPLLVSHSLDFPRFAKRLNAQLEALNSLYERSGQYESAQSVMFLRLEFERVVSLAKGNPAAFDLRKIPSLLPHAEAEAESRESDTVRPKKASNKALLHVRELMGGGMHSSDDEASNAPTPLARPVRSPPGEPDRPETPAIDLGVGRLADSPELARLPRIETSSSDDTSPVQPPGYDPAAAISEPKDLSTSSSLTNENQRIARPPLTFDAPAEGEGGLRAYPGLDRRSSSDSFQFFPNSWGAPAIDSNASSWTRNAAENYGRQPSFRSQGSALSEAWKSEKNISNGSSSLAVPSLGSEAAVDGASLERALRERAMITDLETAVASTDTDTSLEAPFQQPLLEPPSTTGDQIHRSRSSSVASHPESKTVLEESINSLPPVPLTNQALLEAPQQIQTALETIQELLQYHSVQNEVQIASQLFLSIAPALPYMTATVLAQSEYARHESFHESVAGSLNIPLSSVAEVLATCHAPLEAARISPYHIEALLTALHAQLFAHGLNQAAAFLRRISFPAFPGVYEQSQREVETGTLCSGCETPIATSADPMQCETCGAHMAGCPVCESDVSPFPLTPPSASTSDDTQSEPSTTLEDVEAPDTTTNSLFPLYDALKPHAVPAPPKRNNAQATNLWSACAVCAHITHAACAAAWFGDPSAQGACPAPGCLCDCAPGQWRTEREEREAERAGKGGAGSATLLGKGEERDGVPVRRDDWEVNESSAVRKVVGALRGGANGMDCTASEGEGRASSRRRRL